MAEGELPGVKKDDISVELTRSWRFDRMSTVRNPGSGELRASFAQAAK